MSLYRQLWIAIALLMLVVFGATFLINGISSSRYLSEQLSIKNSDDASALALSLSQQQLDPVALELQLTAQLDQGAYSRIRFRRPDGALAFDRSRDFDTRQAPNWLKRLFPIDSIPGQAEVSNGWTRLGTLTLQSHEGFAYDELWALGKRTLIALVAAILVAGGLGSLLLRVILRPLDRVVSQAEAMGQRRFEKQPEPRTRELATVTRAMNALTERMQRMLQTEADRLSDQRRRLEADPVTGLPGRERFAAELYSALAAQDARAEGVLALAHICGMNELNRRHGRAMIDAALRTVGQLLDSTCREQRWIGGRLSGSDLALLAPTAESPLLVAEHLQEAVLAGFAEHALAEPLSLSISCSAYSAADEWSPLLSRLDAALSEQPQDGASPVEVGAATADSMAPHARITYGQTQLDAAFREQRLVLQGFPVRSIEGGLLHREYLVRLEREGELLAAGHFLPWIQRLGLGAALDRRVIELALALAEETEDCVCVNLSAAVLHDSALLQALEGLIAARPRVANRLALEIDEASIYHHLDAFRLFCTVCQRYGIQVGMDRTGRQLADLGRLHDVGLDYVKLEPTFSYNIEHNEGNRNVVRALCTLIHAIGCSVVATDVRESADQRVLAELGVDAVSGPAVPQ